MRISDWSSDVCSSDLGAGSGEKGGAEAIDFDFTAELGGDGWSGRGWRLTRPQLAPVAAEKAQPVPVAAAPVTLPDWARQPAGQEPADRKSPRLNSRH